MVVDDQLLKSLTHKGILDLFQAGFRKHQSTATALIKVTEDFTTGFDRRLTIIALLLNFSKVFDTISPPGPLLFSLYIIDLQSFFTDNGIGHLHYADDLEIYLQCIVISRRSFEVGCGIRSQAALSKMKAIFFAPRQIASMLDKKGFSGVQLGPVTIIYFFKTVLSLGVVLDRTLSWKLHIDSITKEVNRVMYSLCSMWSYTT